MFGISIWGLRHRQRLGQEATGGLQGRGEGWQEVVEEVGREKKPEMLSRKRERNGPSNWIRKKKNGPDGERKWEAAPENNKLINNGSERNLVVVAATGGSR